MPRWVWLGAGIGLAGCRGESLPLEGEHALVAPGVSGVLIADPGGGCREGGVRIGLWGPSWGTPGVVTAVVEEESPGVVWAWFPLRTGVGEGEAALRVEGGAARLPLGARTGEHDVHLRLAPAPDPAAVEAEAAAAAGRLDAEQAAWDDGRFRIVDGEQVVGEVSLRGPDRAPDVAVYDAVWLSPGLVQAARKDDGGDLLLSFPVEPSLGGEQALLRINVATRAAVVPADALPDPMDRALRLEPGAVGEDERAERIAGAIAASEAAERATLLELLPKLARAAQAPDGRCRGPAEVDPAWSLVLAGYRTRVVADGRRCLVEIEPEVRQHGRRFRGVVGSEGLVEGG